MTTKKKAQPAIACFGEVLWDILPQGIFLGGAPMNVAYHLTRLGVRAVPITAVGPDFLGDEARQRIATWPAETSFVARHQHRPTGVVRATLDARGVASYEIAERVAWDHIQVSNALRRIPPSRALVYGSLALRGAANRAALSELTTAWPDTVRVLDLNLRRPFDVGQGVDCALRQAQIIKLNDEELQRQTSLPVRSVREIEAAARQFAAKQQLSRICVTAGARGAGLLWAERWTWEKGRAVEVRDTIGAGDAFLAGFLAAHLIRGEEPKEALTSACRLGEFVAGRDGATPRYRVNARGVPVVAG